MPDRAAMARPEVPAAEAHETWRAMQARLRPFIARRVRAEADVDDVVQDVFLRVQRGIAGLRDEERLGPWLYQVARSAIADHLRRAARHPVTDREALDDEPLEPTVDDGAFECELASHLLRFVDTLRSPYREALVLTDIEGLTQKQAADRLGISLSGMKSRVQRGRQQLRQAIEACCRIALDVRGRMTDCERRTDGNPVEGCCS